MNKLNAIVLGSLLSVSALSAVNAAETTASATWQATATKDSESDLVVTPTRALNFVYSANTKSFNTDTGLFDVAIRGDHSTATSFKLEAILDDSNNTLFSVGGEATKLKVGARWGGNDWALSVAPWGRNQPHGPRWLIPLLTPASLLACGT